MAAGGWYYLAVPDRAAAVALVNALAELGFAQAGARPCGPAAPRPGMLWEVQVVDEGPYPDGVIGDRQRAAAERQARAVARAHGGAMFLSSIFPAVRGKALLLDTGMPVLRVNPGSRPPVPLIRPVAAPPPAKLSLVPDSAVRTLVRPGSLGLDAVCWPELTHAYGPADDIPVLIARLTRGHGKWRADFGTLVNQVLHQGTCYPASAPTLVALARLITADALPAARRRDIYLVLLWAAGLYREDIIELAKPAAAGGQLPPGQWARQVQDAVASIAPGLLARWAGEPSANQLALAALAATFPRHGGTVAAYIASMADEFAGSQVGLYARLAYQLVTADTAGAFATATEIAAWNDGIRAETVDNEFVQPGLRALDILCQAVIAVIEAADAEQRPTQRR